MKRMRCIDACGTSLILEQDAIYDVEDASVSGYYVVPAMGSSHIWSKDRFTEVSLAVQQKVRLKCINTEDSFPKLTLGTIYEGVPCKYTSGYYDLVVAGMAAIYSGKRFVIISDDPTIDVEEMSLRARWVASTITPGCCKSCNAPLPCKWHPV